MVRYKICISPTMYPTHIRLWSDPQERSINEKMAEIPKKTNISTSFLAIRCTLILRGVHGRWPCFLTSDHVRYMCPSMRMMYPSIFGLKFIEGDMLSLEKGKLRILRHFLVRWKITSYEFGPKIEGYMVLVEGHIYLTWSGVRKQGHQSCTPRNMSVHRIPKK